MTISNPTPRQQYILKTFSLKQEGNVWVARWANKDGTDFARIEGADKSRVVYEARCRWGHVNYQDEAEAFATIFPPYL